MNLKKTSSTGPSVRQWALALACATLAGHLALATPYATCLTNNAGTVSFRLNDAADSVYVIGNAGTLTNNLGPTAPGLTVTNLTALGLTGGVFNVVVSKVGTGAIAPIGSTVAFNSPRGVTVNVNPASPYFGRVYVANSASGAKGDGIFVFSSDLSDTFGQGSSARAGGITNFGTGGSSSPFRIKVGHNDDRLYICDWSDASGNLWSTDPDVSDGSFVYVLKQITSAGAGSATSPAAIPVGPNNNHGSVAAVETTGSLATGDLKVFTIDEDYQTDPTVGTPSAPVLNQMNSLWEYDIGAGPLPWSNAPAYLFTPTIGFASQQMDLAHGTNGYFYIQEGRSSGNEAGLFVVDSTGFMVFNSRDESLAEGYTADVLRDNTSVAVSPDCKYVALYGYGYAGFANVITIVPLVDGIPNLSQRFQYTSLANTAYGRGIAFDAADNLYIVSSGLGVLESFSLGFTSTANSGSDGSFSLATPTATVSVTEDTDTIYEPSPNAPAVLTITRTADDVSQPMAVNFLLAGTATRNADYLLQTNNVTITNANAVLIPAGQTSVQASLWPIDDTTSELTETIIFNLVGGGSYNVLSPGSATVAIVDNDTPMIDIAALYTSMYEQTTNDYVRFRLTRRGDTNAPTLSVNLAYSGNAVKDADYVSVSPVAIDPGVVNQNLDVHPLDNSVVNLPRTITVSVASGSGYLIGTNGPASVSASIIDDDMPAETVLWSDNFNTDTSANWTIQFASNDGLPDYSAQFNYDYSADGLPPAPHSGADTHGLKVTVNKGDASAAAAGINFYPIGQSFSGNYALRFDMYLIMGDGALTTEYALLGLNHSGNQVNWFRNSGNGYTNSVYDGLWCYIEADGAALGDYVMNTAPVVNSGGIWSPTAVASRSASTLSGVFKTPPWTVGAGSGGASANLDGSSTPCWAQVELSQLGQSVTLKINNTLIMTCTNTTAFTSGNIMLGYDDAYDSIGPAGASVIYDNVRVVRLAPLQITGIATAGTNALINFTFSSENDPPSAFKLQSATAVAGPYADATATITEVSPAAYQATAGMAGARRFYRIRHQ